MERPVGTVGVTPLGTVGRRVVEVLPRHGPSMVRVDVADVAVGGADVQSEQGLAERLGRPPLSAVVPARRRPVRTLILTIDSADEGLALERAA